MTAGDAAAPGKLVVGVEVGLVETLPPNLAVNLGVLGPGERMGTT